MWGKGKCAGLDLSILAAVNNKSRWTWFVYVLEEQHDSVLSCQHLSQREQRADGSTARGDRGEKNKGSDGGGGGGGGEGGEGGDRDRAAESLKYRRGAEMCRTNTDGLTHGEREWGGGELAAPERQPQQLN